MTKLYLSGGEKGAHRTLLLAAGVERVAVNLTQLRVPTRKEFSFESILPGVKEIVLYTSEGDEDVSRYDEFIRNYVDEIDIIIGRPDYKGDWLGQKYYPIWNDPLDTERLSFICQNYGRAAISDKAITPKTLKFIRSTQQRWGAKLIGITSKADVIDSIQWDAVIVSSWTSALRYGETQVWDGHNLRRYPAQQKESSRKKHRADITRLGIDFDAILDDNVNESGKLAIRSWLAWENKDMAYDPSEVGDEEEFATSQNTEIATTDTEMGTSPNRYTGPPDIAPDPPKKRHQDDMVLLPVVGVERVTTFGSRTVDDQGDSYEIDPEEVPVIRSSGQLLRQCNSCYLAGRCPAYQAHSECGFKLPVEIKTKDQLQSALRTLLEMQVSRVLFARFAEELEGQGLDPTLSKEMTRTFELVEKFRDISDSRELVRMEIETRSSGGVLSRLFGAKAGEAVRQLPGGPVQASQFDQLALDIIDVDEG